MLISEKQLMRLILFTQLALEGTPLNEKGQREAHNLLSEIYGQQSDELKFIGDLAELRVENSRQLDNIKKEISNSSYSL